MIHCITQADLQTCSTLALSGTVRNLWQLAQLEQLAKLREQIGLQACRFIGMGSNVVFVGDYAGALIQITDARWQVLEQTSDAVVVKVAAGMGWDDFVRLSLQQGWYGLENLALIPGTVGAAPIQNIGAYGVECGSVLQQVNVFDWFTGEQHQLTGVDCKLGYRDSIFKREEIKSRWLITSVIWRLSRQWRRQLTYPDLQPLQEQVELNPQQVYQQVRLIRQRKLPDPKRLPNVGSFFKNPLVTHAEWEDLQQRFVGIRGFVAEQQVKIAAAWLIDYCGWKGRRQGQVGVHNQQALVLVNFGGASATELISLAFAIQNSVWQTFGIWLLPEPEFIGDAELWQHLLQPTRYDSPPGKNTTIVV